MTGTRGAAQALTAEGGEDGPLTERLANLGYFWGGWYGDDPVAPTWRWLLSDGAGNAMPVSPGEQGLIDLLLAATPARQQDATPTERALTAEKVLHIKARHFRSTKDTMEPEPANPGGIRQTAYCQFCATSRPDEDSRWPCETARLLADAERAARAEPGLREAVGRVHIFDGLLGWSNKRTGVEFYHPWEDGRWGRRQSQYDDRDEPERGGWGRLLADDIEGAMRRQRVEGRDVLVIVGDKDDIASLRAALEAHGEPQAPEVER
jgi:hypothetical protein